MTDRQWACRWPPARPEPRGPWGRSVGGEGGSSEAGGPSHDEATGTTRTASRSTGWWDCTACSQGFIFCQKFLKSLNIKNKPLVSWDVICLNSSERYYLIDRYYKLDFSGWDELNLWIFFYWLLICFQLCKKNLEGLSFFVKGGKPFCKSHARG